jgi:3-oxoacyl-[acyl-carrier-protein] synthase II
VDRRVALGLRAAEEAWKGAEISADPDRVGVFVGAEGGRADWKTVLDLSRAAGGGSQFDYQEFGRRASSLAGKLEARRVSPASVASAIARLLGSRGSVQTVSLACASGSAAIAEGMRAVRLGSCDAALCGGVGADVDPLMLAAFGLLGVLSARGVSRPFDVYRDGFVVGEGAAMVVLSSERGAARVQAAGFGRTLDAYHLTAPDPRGDGASRAIQAALADAELSSVDYVQAHGTSTPLNDPAEVFALRRVLGSALDGTYVSSVKGALGHWVAGAGALGFLCAVEAVSSGTILPTAGLKEPDPSCQVPHVIGKAFQKDIRAALCNSFAFGGANCCIAVRRVE